MRYRNSVNIIVLLFLACLSQVVYAHSSDELFNRGVSRYTQQEYNEASLIFEEIIAKGDVSSEVYYNLGNSYYKSGELGKSILSFERARLLNPDATFLPDATLLIASL